MSVFVDPLAAWGWRLRGHLVSSCHLFTDAADLAELHRIAAAAGMRRAWFQDKPSAPHYDLTAAGRQAAIAAGALEVDRRRAVEIWRARRELLQQLQREACT